MTSGIPRVTPPKPGDVLPTRTHWKDHTLGHYREEDHLEPAEPGTSNLIGSLCDDGRHMPIIDIDVPHRYVESSTPGHGHLYLDVPMSWEQAEELLYRLVCAGVVEDGYHEFSRRHSQMFARVRPDKHLEALTEAPF